jgi:hypothetical protein
VTDFFITGAMDDSDGYSIYMKSKYIPSKKWEMSGEFRDYSRFFFPYNNAPRYMGITGGDDNNEQGFLARIGYLPQDWISVYFQYDQTDNKTNSQLYRDTLGEIRFKISKEFNIALGIETEIHGEDDSVSGAALLSYQFENSAKITGGYNYDETPYNKFSASRVYFRYPVIQNNLFATLQYTYRTGVEEGKSNPRIGIDWKLFGSSNLSVRYSYLADSKDTLDVLFFLRF